MDSLGTSSIWYKFAGIAERNINEVRESYEKKFGIKISLEIRKYGEKHGDDVVNPFGLLYPVLEVRMSNTEGFLQLIQSDFPIRSNDPRIVTEKYFQIMEDLENAIKEII